jgi:hypothetical protein
VSDSSGSNSESSGKSGIPLDAGTAGIGLGTLVAVVAERLPDDADAKPWLLVFAPSISVIISYAWAKGRSGASDWLARWEAQRIFKEAKQTLEEGLNNPNTSEEHKAQLRADLERLEHDFIKNKTDRFRAKLR